jgi:hypothetical protein
MPAVKAVQYAKKSEYVASPTMEAFHLSLARIRMIMGPIGSGKSVACCMELFRVGSNQQADAEGIRRTRMVVVRNTFPELKNTTIKTWVDWFPPGDPAKGRTGKMSSVSPITHTVQVGLPDGTRMEMEVIFLALDQPDDVKKLLSLECTGVWFNEVKFIDRAMIDGAGGRIGRYPSIKTGVPCTRKFIIADTNPPDDQSWFYELAEVEKPDGWNFFFQPSGMAAEAENLENLNQPPNYAELSLAERREHGRAYYADQLPGKKKEWIDVYIHGRYGFVQEGYPVYARVWNRDLHVQKEPVRFIPVAAHVVGIDCSGRHPAACLFQRNGRGHWRMLWELCITADEGMAARDFARLLKESLVNLGVTPQRVEFWGDPAGQYPDTNEETFYQILRGQGIRVRAVKTNLLEPRIQVVKHYLSQLLDGEPLFSVSPTCTHAIRAFDGGYQYRKISTSGTSRPDDKPIKDRFSDVMDAIQYALLGIGGMKDVMGRKEGGGKPVQINTAWSVFS